MILTLKNAITIYPAGCLLIIIACLLLGLIGYRYRNEVRKRISIEKIFSATEFNLKNLLEEKEWLLREVNHRVKNNLQVMISLLNSQEFFLKNSEALDAIKNSQRRLHAISLAYQKVYEPINPAVIDMNTYITELVDYLQDEYQKNSDIECSLYIDKTSLPISSAVPIGLIINEALSNSFQYAFPATLAGKIEIKFICKKEDGSFLLSVSDNGIGFSEPFETVEIKSLGTNLMIGLSKQLRGKFQLKNHDGVSVSVEFSNLISENPYLA